MEGCVIMNKKYLSSILVLLLVVTVLFTSQNKPSYSLEETSPISQSANLDLEYTTNETILKNNLYNFINLIDDTLIPLYEYNDGLSLNDNYPFMTNFALNFISNNLNYYQSKVITDNSTKASRYVPLELIYEITASVFNRRYYHITNQQLTITNGYVSLITESYPIEMNLTTIDNITKNNNQLLVTVKYDEMDFSYQYEFIITDNKLSLKNLNIEV